MATIYIATKDPYQHTYWVYDPDDDPYSGDESIIRGGLPDVAGNTSYVIEADRPIADSRDALNGDDPYTDRNYTTVVNGSEASVQAIWDDMLEKARSLGNAVPDPNGAYSGETVIQLPEDHYWIPAPDCHTLTGTVGEAGGIDVLANLPKDGGDTGSGQRTPSQIYIGLDARLLSTGDGTVVVTAGQKAYFDQGGSDTYVIDGTQPPKGGATIFEDADSGTLDKIVINGVDPEDLVFQKSPTGDLSIYKRDPNGNSIPIATIKDQFDDGFPRMNTVWVYPPGGGSPSILPLNDPDNFTPGVPAPVPGWIPAGVYGPFNDSIPMGSPLIVDLDNDGVEATQFDPQATTSFFDIDNDGFREQTAWVGADDGLLVRDLDASGTIDSAAELFGSATTDGFALLSILDSNGDHVVDASDADFGDLMIWKDANGDAQVQGGELQSLAFWNIASISLAGITASTSTINGNDVSHTSTVTLTSGATRAIADVWFAHDNINSYHGGDYELDIRTLFLPDLRGFGEMPDLHIAMSQDEDLLGMVQALAANWSMESFATGDALSDVENILLKWAGVDGVDPYSRKEAYLDAFIDIDSRHLAFLEKFLGQDYFNTSTTSDTPGPQAYQVLQEAWQFALKQMQAQLLAQVGANILFGDTIAYNVWTGSFDGTLDLSQAAIEALVAPSTAVGVDTEAYWRNVSDFIAFTVGTNNLSPAEEAWLNDAIYDSDPSLTWNFVKAPATYTGITEWGTTADNTMNGSVYNDNLHGGEGNDTLYGGDRHDLLYGDSGNDIVWGGTGSDQIWGDLGVDTIYGEDGRDIVYAGQDNDFIDGGNGNDEIYGESGADTLAGGLGGNLLDGGTGNDVYIYGGGADIIVESDGTDVIALPDGVTPGDIVFSRLYDQYQGSLLITIAGAGSIEIENQFHSYSGFRVETLDFYDPLDGTINLTAITSLTTHGTDAGESILGVTNPTYLNETILGYGGDDYIEGKAGNDTIDGGVGNDGLYGAGGNDTYIASNGFDEIWDESGSNDVIVIPAAFTANDVSLMRSSGLGTQHLLIQIAGLGQIKVGYQFQGYHIEKIVFANGIDSDITLDTVAFDAVGTEGSDSLSGLTSLGAPDEHLYGYGGNDTLTGNNGNDVLDGGAGNDSLYGDDGDDTFVFSAGSDVIRDTTGNDVLLIPEAYDLSDVSFYRLASEYMYYVHVAVAGLGDVQIIDQLPGNLIEKVSFANGVDADILFSNVSYAVRGTSANDYIFGLTSGSSPNETFYGYAGNDTIVANTGNDFIDGGDGDDNIDGGADTDTLSYLTASAAVNVSLAVGGAQVTGGSGTDTITNVENLNGSIYGDLLIGNSGNNVINGDSGDDVIEGGVGNDTLIGGFGTDTLSYAGTGMAVTVNLATTTAQNTVGAGTDTVSGFENLRGSAANDTLTGNGNANVIEGGAGNDTINGAGGTDTLAYVNAAAAVTVNLATTTAQNTVGAGTDTISNFENLTGSSYDDTLTGSSIANVISGGAGNDTISGADGNDTLDGGDGNDTLTGGNGTDTVTYAGAVSAVTVSLAITTGQNTGGAGTDTIATVENLIGSVYGDTLTGSTAANVIQGGDGNDAISAGDGNDTLNGGAGDDSLTGGNGTDTATYIGAASAVTVSLAIATAQNTGGAGTDTLATIENLTGSAFGDTLTGNSGANTIAGGDGDDTVEGAAGNDTLTGGNGTDTVSYASAASAVTFNLSTTTSQITGGAGSDTVSGFENVTGSAYNDTLTGDGNANVIKGGAGNDILSGGAGNDILYGEAGLDAMTGGLNADIFVFQASSAYGNIDTISDFSTAQGDALNLANLLGDYDPLTEAITDFVLAATSGADTSISVDRDGTGTTYGFTQIATLTGVTGLTDEAALVANGNLIVA